ncbi:MAG TPA: hypothetical protein VNQ78_17290, partial [Paracoccus sp. (in: a-proteobacteria)]|nr:hypothetical protein [Paracoccus sp. (in: a-proteobacteria)]
MDAVGGPTRPRRTIVIHGALSNEPTRFPLKLALRKNLSLRGSYYIPGRGLRQVRRGGQHPGGN